MGFRWLPVRIPVQIRLNGRSARHSTADTAKDSGTVVLNVCVDTSGIIQSTVLNVDKSTTLDPVLVDKALSKTKEMRFAPTKSGATKCGDIRFKFKLKKP